MLIDSDIDCVKDETIDSASLCEGSRPPPGIANTTLTRMPDSSRTASKRISPSKWPPLSVWYAMHRKFSSDSSSSYETQRGCTPYLPKPPSRFMARTPPSSPCVIESDIDLNLSLELSRYSENLLSVKVVETESCTHSRTPSSSGSIEIIVCAEVTRENPSTPLSLFIFISSSSTSLSTCRKRVMPIAPIAVRFLLFEPIFFGGLGKLLSHPSPKDPSM
mmetsp:Transcript_27872/g.63431  ORF Transcript_27872/g.63431 Transcript_27872/m.63431 type:complete len:219 (-) Transcript_27872:257-913(-)